MGRITYLALLEVGSKIGKLRGVLKRILLCLKQFILLVIDFIVVCSINTGDTLSDIITYK